ncbi:hypothetical protein I3842_13G001800 [Carya illinoinensis]|uniref:Uncharacterized protein n=1 Tax=Carya illinoinensis TaxID=32201 RepID=A0A922AKL7_CARIL|nr:hypothetical protein I3842_13G001800 [Carya illinoinensis]
MWLGIVEKIEGKFVGWKIIYLSKGGEITLIKSTLSDLPTYFISLFPVLAGVANRLEKIFRCFLWGGIEDVKKFHLIKWDKVCTPLSCSGLGVRKLRTFNKALLGKWLWRYHQEGDAYGVGVWKLIWNGWDDFLCNCRLEVGSGMRIRFWHDIWYGDIALKNAFPSLYRIVSD